MDHNAYRGGVARYRDAMRAEHEADRHAHAAAQYREEREYAAQATDYPWWIDLGGEGGPC